MYTVKGKVSYELDGKTKYKVNSADIVKQNLLTDDKQAVKWGMILLDGFKAYYTKKAYTIRVQVEGDDGVLMDETFQHQDDDVITW